CSSYAGSNVLV
nr:immunoglobulin light chain junction region [Macaca mulatta]MPO10443.1 immunoglobulin light chain junction region [Macaca mulatta]MPO12100.1 immunoglobulin light chain junction region [Macaca mulatta]MPO13295.1 immunoglobulin light chain junction region [Macaca mulatta]